MSSRAERGICSCVVFAFLVLLIRGIQGFLTTFGMTWGEFFVTGFLGTSQKIDNEILITNGGKGEGCMVRPARMEAERARFLSEGEGSEAVIGADSLAGGIRVPAKYASLSLPP